MRLLNHNEEDYIAPAFLLGVFIIALAIHLALRYL